MTRVKICGIRDPETALAAAKAGADFIGIVFAQSKRRVTPQQCHDIVEALKAERRQGADASFEGPLRGEVSAASWYGAWNEAIDDALARWRPLIVGVFADQEASEVNDIADAAGLDLVQLSGGETREFVAKVHCPTFWTVHVGPGMTAFDVFDKAAPGIAAGLHLDTQSSEARGGTGESFDWSVAAEVGARWPIMLAGGLTPETVAEAITRAEPWAVDVSTGVETDGAKDVEKIRAFIRATKGVRVGR